MKESSSYYSSTCKNCGKDCDDTFCSYVCQLEWEEGKADYEYQTRRDNDDSWGS